MTFSLTRLSLAASMIFNLFFVVFTTLPEDCICCTIIDCIVFQNLFLKFCIYTLYLIIPKFSFLRVWEAVKRTTRVASDKPDGKREITLNLHPKIITSDVVWAL